ncbi:MAG: cytidylate kinase-like family protein [Oscillospiraceae bacterium]|nr:cytidylate kinase-like family protein [Oscillospiraceae bacterium]
MRLITISRQFGSGGRELGKRISDILGWDYYDKEIIQRLADDQGLDPEYVKNVLSNHGWNTLPMTFRSSFSSAVFSNDFNSDIRTTLMIRQREIIENIAAAGNDCIIVGRDADIILSDHRPLRIFVCAELKKRIDRCMRFEEKKEEGRLTEKEIEKNIRRIDKERSQIRELLTGLPWGDASAFDLSVNSSGWEIKSLAPAVSDFALRWFER